MVVGQDTSASEQGTASKILIRLEQCEIADKQLEACIAEKEEVIRQKGILLEETRLQEEQKTELRGIIELQKKAAEAQKKIHEEELKAVKPTFLGNLQKVGVGFSVGVVLTVIAVLVL